MKNIKFLKLVVLSLAGATVFGLVDALFFFTAEDTLQEKIMRSKNFDATSAELLTGGISAAVAILVAGGLSMYIEKHFHLIDHPLLDMVGIMIGTLLVVAGYMIINKLKHKGGTIDENPARLSNKQIRILRNILSSSEMKKLVKN